MLRRRVRGSLHDACPPAGRGTGSRLAELACVCGPQDSNLSIGVGFLHTDAVKRAADCYKDKNFAIVDTTYSSFPNNNLEGLEFMDEEGGYLAGARS